MESIFRPSDLECERTVGEGSFSQIIKAKMKESNSIFAIKRTILAKISRTKYAAVPESEAGILKRLSHPNIIRYVSQFSDRFSYNLITEFAPNGDFREFSKSHKSLPTQFVRHIMAQLVSAIAYIHSQGVIHLDIKPENILLSENLCLKLCDFGTARLFDPAGGNGLSKGIFAGSPEYMSPEVVNEGESSTSSDLWGLGCTIHAVFSESSPFYSKNRMEIFRMITQNEPHICGDICPEAKDLIEKLIEPRPEKRIGYNEYKIGYPSIKNHPFFSGIHWDGIEIDPPGKYLTSKVEC